MKTINNSCGKKSGCCADITLPYGIATQNTDSSLEPRQAGSGSTQVSKRKYEKRI